MANNKNIEYEIGRVYDILKKDLSIHKKVVNIFKINNKIENFPKLPPMICPCIITLRNGKTYKAYIDTQICGNVWTEYGNTFTIRMNGRRKWEYDEVVNWELI